MGSGLEEVRVKKTLTLNDAAALHGHKGPFLVLGYKIGEYAVNVLNPIDELDIETKAYIPFEPPFSCILDGLQCSTKCTLGKKNIECINSNEMMMEFKRKSNGRKLRIWLKKSVVERSLKCGDLGRIVEELEKTPVGFLIEKIVVE